MSYKAAYVYGQNDIRILEVEKESLKPNEVLIEIYNANVCPTDLRGYRGVKELNGPEKVGHEFAGYVREIGSNVSKFSEGDRVTALSWSPCFVCHHCVRGKFSACAHRNMNMGGFAEYITLHEDVVYHLPNELSFEKAAFAEPLGSVLKANTEITPVKLGDTVVVYGLGPMGQLHAQVAQLMGASKVIGIDLIQSRLDIALDNGINHVINADEEDPVQEVFKLTEDKGADIVMVTVGGAAEAVCTEISLKMVSHGGSINIFTGTYPNKNISLDPNLIHYKEIIVTGTRSYNIRTFELALDLLAKNKVNIDCIRFPEITFNEIEKGFKLHGTKDAMKVGINFK